MISISKNRKFSQGVSKPVVKPIKILPKIEPEKKKGGCNCGK